MTRQDFLDRGWGNWDMYPGGGIVFQKDQDKEVYYELTTRIDSPDMRIVKIMKEQDPVYSPERRQVLFDGMCHFKDHFDLLCVLIKITPYKETISTMLDNFKAK